MVYRQPRVVNRVVYRTAPVYQPRVMYRQPRAVTRVVYRQNRPARIVRNGVRRDVVTTGSIRNNAYRVRAQTR